MRQTNAPWVIVDTHGPYQFTGGDNDVPVVEITTPCGENSDNLWHKAIEVRGPDAEDVARLIAAAPELLEALQGLITFTEAAETKMLVGDEGCLWPVEFARAAIAKATGAA